MKNKLIYLVILVLGVLLGALIFGGGSKSQVDHNHQSENVKETIYTCSMHPQIRQTEPGNCPICGMDLIPAETAEEGLAANAFKMSSNAMALANIQTSLVGQGEMSSNGVKLSGKIAENEEENAVQVSYFSGRIEKLYVNFTGEQIKKGQLLANIYSPELFAAQQELLTAASIKESQPSLYKAVRNKLKLWKLSENQIDQIESSGKVKENFPVYATVSGTVSEKMVAEGDYIKQGQALLKIADLSTVWAIFDVYENQIDLFKKGQNILITTNAYANKEFKAKIAFIDPTLDSRTRTLKLRAVLSNKNSEFKPGMFIEGRVEGVYASSNKEISIPASAVLWTGERSLVYIKTNTNQPTFEMREVHLGKQIGESYQVKNGLENGDEIVTNGTFTVDAAAQLQGKRSMMNKTGGITSTGHEGHTRANVQSTIDASMKMEFPKTFQNDFVEAIAPYMQMKDAFIQSDQIAVAKNAQLILKKLKSINLTGLKKMEAAHFNTSIQYLETIAINKNIDNQRKHFVLLNEQFISLVSNMESMTNPLYILECPMADNNKGARWLSLEKKVLNPYYGDLMLNCGSVIETIN